ncbi:MAG: zinc-ribbon domain-containing protein [Blastocatellia bacterium]
MFCPNCGRDNSRETRFCASCGTNLEAVSQALNGTRDDFFTKTDAALDQLIARYAEHVFKDAPSKLNDRRVSNSWKVLGQGVVTSFVDLILFSLMWNIFPLRFLILLISTPIKMLSRRGSGGSTAMAGHVEDRGLSFVEPSPDRWLPGSFPSVSEHTTRDLESRQPERKQAARRE